MRIFVINAHPDAGSLSDAIADSYVSGARHGGHDVRTVNLRDLQFDLVLRGGFHSTKPLEPVLKHCGFRPVRRTALYGAKDSSPEARAAFLALVRVLGEQGK